MHKEKETHTTIRGYNEADKNAVINLIRLNTPDFFSPNEEKDLINYLETEREFYYVLLFDGRIVGCGGINFADNITTYADVAKFAISASLPRV